MGEMEAYATIIDLQHGENQGPRVAEIVIQLGEVVQLHREWLDICPHGAVGTLSAGDQQRRSSEANLSKFLVLANLQKVASKVANVFDAEGVWDIESMKPDMSDEGR